MNHNPWIFAFGLLGTNHAHIYIHILVSVSLVCADDLYTCFVWLGTSQATFSRSSYFWPQCKYIARKAVFMGGIDVTVGVLNIIGCGCRPTFVRVCRKKSTEGFQSIPYVVALFSALLLIYYSTLNADEFFLMTINSVGCFIETIYIALYITYAPKKARVNIYLYYANSLNILHACIHASQTNLRFISPHLQTFTVRFFLLLDVVGFCSILAVTQFLVKRPYRARVIGFICGGLSVSVFAAPLSIMVGGRPQLILFFYYLICSTHCYCCMAL